MFLALEKFEHFMIQTFATNLLMKPNKKKVTVLELWKLPPFYFTMGSVVVLALQIYQKLPNYLENYRI